MEDSVNFHERAARQRRDADCGARRVGFVHVLRHDLVDPREVRKVDEVDGHAHGVIKAHAGGVSDSGEVTEDAVRLRLDTLCHLHGCGIEPNLAGKIDRVGGAHGLRIGADRRWRLARLDRCLHAAYLSVVSALIPGLEKLLGTPRDGALLRYSLGLEYEKAGRLPEAAAQLREAVTRDPLYSAAWKALGRLLSDTNPQEALAAFRQGIAAAKQKGDRQAEKEMTVFARRIEKALGGPA